MANLIHPTLEPEGASHRLDTLKRFGRYKDESEKKIRDAKIRDEILEQMEAAYEKSRFSGTWRKGQPDEYELLLSHIKDIDYSARDVERFCIALARFQGEEWFGRQAGHILSALINNGKDDDFTIPTKHLSERIHFLGSHNTKNVAVEGDLAEWIGKEMTAGRIHIRGNIIDGVGTRMHGGTIIVEGNVHDCDGIGECMDRGHTDRAW